MDIHNKKKTLTLLVLDISDRKPFRPNVFYSKLGQREKCKMTEVVCFDVF